MSINARTLTQHELRTLSVEELSARLGIDPPPGRTPAATKRTPRSTTTDAKFRAAMGIVDAHLARLSAAQRTPERIEELSRMAARTVGLPLSSSTSSTRTFNADAPELATLRRKLSATRLTPPQIERALRKRWSELRS